MNIDEAPTIHDPASAPPQDAAAYQLNSVGMGALAHAAAGQVEQHAKRPGEPLEEGAPAFKKPKSVWESLLTEVRNHLRAMSSDECFSRALELQMLARSEVGSRSLHLSNAMDLMANNGQVGQVPMISKPSGGGRKSAPPMPNMAATVVTASGQRVTKAEREVSKQKPIKTTKAAPVPCMKMTPPLPPRCENDNAPDVELPAFCQLVNFPTARYYGNCVMCDEAEFPIPKQNKGVCNNCDVAIWVVNPSGMNIKWCKGCKNFRKWVDFGVKVCVCVWGFAFDLVFSYSIIPSNITPISPLKLKGYSSKCDRCRHQQAVRYANQKTKDGVPVDVDGDNVDPEARNQRKT